MATEKKDPFYDCYFIGVTSALRQFQKLYSEKLTAEEKVNALCKVFDRFYDVLNNKYLDKSDKIKVDECKQKLT